MLTSALLAAGQICCGHTHAKPKNAKDDPVCPVSNNLRGHPASKVSTKAASKKAAGKQKAGKQKAGKQSRGKGPAGKENERRLQSEAEADPMEADESGESSADEEVAKAGPGVEWHCSHVPGARTTGSGA